MTIVSFKKRLKEDGDVHSRVGWAMPIRNQQATFTDPVFTIYINTRAKKAKKNIHLFECFNHFLMFHILILIFLLTFFNYFCIFINF